MIKIECQGIKALVTAGQTPDITCALTDALLTTSHHHHEHLHRLPDRPDHHDSLRHGGGELRRGRGGGPQLL